ncbi:MAG: CoA protein activase [Clostridia bacterium]|nr:CoA protein activase [Clostridia bacterium]
MKITFPHMGNMWVAVKGMLEYMGLDVIVPPPPTRETLTLGVQHSPEFACLPLKINIGNFIEAKKLGADTIIMAGGTGPCRFGLYAQLEKEILQDLGFNYNSLIIEPPDKGYWQFIKRVKKVVGPVSWWKIIQGVRIGYKKAIIVDCLEKIVQEIRPREYSKGTADKIFNYSLQTIDKAQNFNELEEAYGLAREKLLHIPKDEYADILKIGLVGEIYTLLEPFASMNIEKKLGYMGAYVQRSLYLSEWINHHLLSSRFLKTKGPDYKAYASPFLNHFVGGHGMESIGAGVAFAKEGYDGIVQVAPLTCMPEIVAHNIFPQVSEKCGIPVINIYVDEQTGEAGLETRLEAFMELLESKRQAKRRPLTEKKQYVTIP